MLGYAWTFTTSVRGVAAETISTEIIVFRVAAPRT
jgi:hypothetical protein